MLYSITIPPFIRALNNLKNILEKGAQHAEDKKFEMAVLLQSRLAPDQFNLIRQVQITCDTAKLAVSRLTGKDAPIHADTETNLMELKSRIESVIAYLEGFKKTDFEGAEERAVSNPRWEGKYLLGAEFAVLHAIPNVYFHLTTAYSILRHNGVPIGKKDYLGEMPYRK